MKTTWLIILLAAALSAAHPLAAQQEKAPAGDIPVRYEEAVARRDYIKRVVEIPMRDGVKLHTVIVVPKGAHDAPVILTRTPYSADKRTERIPSDLMRSILPQADEVFVDAGYIRVYQDVRGKHSSEGDYEMTRPVRGPLNLTATDNVTDAWDTTDWLVKNLPESNGRVGMLGSSYEGFTVVMALLDPHPALKVAAPESPMINGWMGDDFFHYGAYRQEMDDYLLKQESSRKGGPSLITGEADQYEAYLRAGSAGDFGKLHKLGQIGMWRRITEHVNYDGYWQGQALEDLVAKNPSKVPTLWEQGLWDQEDMWGAIHAWSALKAAGHIENNYLAIGPWRHSQANFDGYGLGPLQFNGDTAAEWRRSYLLAFFNYYLKPGSPKPNIPRALIYNTGENRWDKFDDWPLACEDGCPGPLKPLYLSKEFSLSFDAPTGDGGDSYISDPSKPVPYVSRPIAGEGDQWKTWLVSDQRNVGTRPDVLVYETPVLEQPVRVSGATVADLYAATTGSDADWVVKLIDVQPGENPSDPTLAGYQLPIAMDIFRGRYRESFEQPTPIPPGQIQRYRFALPTANHVFQKGHRIMVQIQSSWFPLYDRNPQTYVSNIFWAQPSSYKSATMTVFHNGNAASALWLPIVGPGADSQKGSE